MAKEQAPHRPSQLGLAAMLATLYRLLSACPRRQLLVVEVAGRSVR